MFERFTDRARKVVAMAHQEAMRWGHEEMNNCHVLLALLRSAKGPDCGMGGQILREIIRPHGDLDELTQNFERGMGPVGNVSITSKLPQTPRTKAVFQRAADEAKNFGHDHIGTEHVLYALVAIDVDSSGGLVDEFFRGISVNAEQVRDVIISVYGMDVDSGYREDDDPFSGIDPRRSWIYEEVDQLVGRESVRTEPLLDPILRSKCLLDCAVRAALHIGGDIDDDRSVDVMELMERAAATLVAGIENHRERRLNENNDDV